MEEAAPLLDARYVTTSVMTRRGVWHFVESERDVKAFARRRSAELSKQVPLGALNAERCSIPRPECSLAAGETDRWPVFESLTRCLTREPGIAQLLRHQLAIY